MDMQIAHTICKYRVCVWPTSMLMANEGMPCGLGDIPLKASPSSSLSFASHNLYVQHPLHNVGAQPGCTMAEKSTNDGAHGLAIVWFVMLHCLSNKHLA